MKKKVIISIASLIWKIAVPVLSAILGLLAVEKCNLFLAFHLIEDANRAFDVCTTVYFAIIDIILHYFAEGTINRFFTQQSIKVIFSKPGDSAHENSIPEIMLQDGKPCEVNLTIEICANKKTCEGLRLFIDGINFATMQLPKSSLFAKVDADGNFSVDLEKLFGNQEKANTTQTFRILFSKEPVEGICQSEIYPRLTKEPLLLSLTTNRLIIKAEE